MTIGQDEAGLQFFYCLNDVWMPALKMLGKLSDGNRGVKHVITEEELLKADPEIRRRCQELEEKEGLVLGPMVESDIPLMIESNGVKYDEEYGRFIIRRSLCFRNKKGEMVAWAGTHGDCKSSVVFTFCVSTFLVVAIANMDTYSCYRCS